MSSSGNIDTSAHPQVEQMWEMPFTAYPETAEDHLALAETALNALGLGSERLRIVQDEDALTAFEAMLEGDLAMGIAELYRRGGTVGSVALTLTELRELRGVMYEISDQANPLSKTYPRRWDEMRTLQPPGERGILSIVEDGAWPVAVTD